MLKCTRRGYIFCRMMKRILQDRSKVLDAVLYTPECVKSRPSRAHKVAMQMKECFSLALSRGDFPILPNHEEESRLPTPVTITYIDLSPDLRSATVYFIPLGGLKKDETTKFFELQRHYFKDLIAKKMKMRFIPELNFKFDTSFEYSERIDSLLHNVNPKR